MNNKSTGCYPIRKFISMNAITGYRNLPETRWSQFTHPRTIYVCLCSTTQYGRWAISVSDGILPPSSELNWTESEKWRICCERNKWRWIRVTSQNQGWRTGRLCSECSTFLQNFRYPPTRPHGVRTDHTVNPHLCVNKNLLFKYYSTVCVLSLTYGLVVGVRGEV